MSEGKIIMFENRLSKVYRHVHKQAKRQQVSCYRIYDHDLPEFPFCIEIYGDKLYVAEYKRRHGMTEEEHDGWMEESLQVMSKITGIPPTDVFLKLRQRKAGRLGQYQKVHETNHEFTVQENNLHFIVNLSDYLDTGLFLDHRVTRELVREQANGKNVLNLFAYTGSFSVYAAAGGAAQVTTVDLSKTYLDWAEKNMRNNGFTGNNYSYLHADVKQYGKTIPAGYFDIVVMDPPTFSNSKRMDGFLDIQRDHVELINDCLAAMKPGGRLYFSTNFRKFVLDRQQLASDQVKDITKNTTPFDFEGKLARWCYLIVKEGD